MRLRPQDLERTKGPKPSAPRTDGNTKIFLGYEWSKEEYQIIAQNFADYFSILKKWRQQEDRSEKKENL